MNRLGKKGNETLIEMALSADGRGGALWHPVLPSGDPGPLGAARQGWDGMGWGAARGAGSGRLRFLPGVWAMGLIPGQS